MGIFFRLIILGIILLFPLGELLRIDLGSNIILHPIDVPLAVFTISWWIYIILLKKALPQYKKQKFLFLFPLLGFISLLINSYWLKPNELLASAAYDLRWFGYMSVFIAISTFESKFKRKIVKLFLAVGVIILLSGYLQYFFYPSLLDLFKYGWDKHMNRMVTVFLDPNFAGTFYVLYFIFLIGIFYDFWLRKKVKICLILGLLSACTLLAVFLTYSRSAILMFLVGICVFVILINKKKLIYGAFGITLIAFILAIPEFNKESTNLLRVTSSIARITSAEEALSIIQKNPVFGVGFDAYRYAQIKYGTRTTYSKYPNHADAGTDNSYLFIIATTGVIGFTAYIGMWAWLIKSVYSVYKKKKSVFSLIILASLSALFIDCLFINSLFYPPVMLWVWIILGFTENI